MEKQTITKDDVADVSLVLGDKPFADYSDDEKDAHVRLIARTCRGPMLTTVEQQREAFDHWYVLEEANDVAGALEAIGALFEAARKLKHPGYKMAAFPELDLKEIVPEPWEALRRRAFPLIRLYGDRVGRGCGWDLNEEITGQPYDGESRSVECPECGSVLEYTSPVFY